MNQDFITKFILILEKLDMIGLLDCCILLAKLPYRNDPNITEVLSMMRVLYKLSLITPDEYDFINRNTVARLYPYG